MNEKNIEIIKTAYECFGRGDVPGLLGLMSADIGWTIPVIEGAPFSGVRRGRAAVGEFFALLAACEDRTSFVPGQFIADGDKVVVIGDFSTTIRLTGKSYSTEWVHIFTINDGIITNFLEFYDNAAATRAYQRSAAAA